MVDLDPREIGRLLLRDLVSHALKSGDELWFGDALVRFDDKIRTADDASGTARCSSRASSWVGRTGCLEVPSSPRSTPPRARKIRVYATPSSEGGTAYSRTESYLATYFRVRTALP